MKEKTNAIINQRNVLSVTAAAVSAVFVAVMWISGFNFLSVVAAVLSAAVALIICIFYLLKKEIHVWLLLSYLILIGGVLFYYVIWGAESFLKRAGYNLLLSFAPAAASLLVIFADKIFSASYKKTVIAVLCVLMVASSSLYFLAMSIRARPKVFSMQKGHDEYLASLKNKASADSPNVLFILMDDMAYSDLSCYSYLGRQNATIKTPNLDMLADEGVKFENFYACSPVCSPSRFGLLTGRYSARGYMDQVVFPSKVSFRPFGDTRYFNAFTLKNNVEGILGDEITVAEALQSAGYSTALFGKWNLGDYGEYLPTRQGFDYFYGSYYVNDMTPYNWVREVNGKAEEVKSHYEIKDQSQTTKLLTEEVNRYIEKSVGEGEKFFAYYATPWPHYPIYSGEKNDSSDDSYILCIEEFDRYLGGIINTLKEQGVYDDTLIMFTSDNGPGREGVTGALRGRKGTTFEGGQKVPFIASYKNGNIGKNGHIITTPAMNIDVFPTLLEYAGITALPNDRIIDGVSLHSLLEGVMPDGTPVHDALYYLRSGKVQGVQMPVTANGNVSHYKYYKAVASENTAFFDQVYKNYLFNLSLDPAEGYNISMTYPDIAKTLAAQLTSFKNELKDNRRGINKEYYGK